MPAHIAPVGFRTNKVGEKSPKRGN